MRSPLCFGALGTGQAGGAGPSLGSGLTQKALQAASSGFGLNMTVTICPALALKEALETAAH